jgi:hypothetical protein
MVWKLDVNKLDMDRCGINNGLSWTGDTTAACQGLAPGRHAFAGSTCQESWLPTGALGSGIIIIIIIKLPDQAKASTPSPWDLACQQLYSQQACH